MSKTSFQSFILALCQIVQMQSEQTYSRISTWPQHILINNLLSLDKDRKRNQAGCLGSS